MINTPSVIKTKEKTKISAGRYIRGETPAHMEGIVVKQIPHASTPSWEILFEDNSKQIMSKQDIIPRLLPLNDQLREAKTRLLHPNSLIGLPVTKKFKHIWYCGIISNTDVDAANDDILWEVTYQDGDKSDYNLPDITPLISQHHPRSKYPTPRFPKTIFKHPICQKKTTVKDSIFSKPQ